MVRVDARGMRCPWPAVRLAKALRDGATSVEVIADDPQAAGELAAVARASQAEIDMVLDAICPRFIVTSL